MHEGNILVVIIAVCSCLIGGQDMYIMYNRRAFLGELHDTAGGNRKTAYSYSEAAPRDRNQHNILLPSVLFHLGLYTLIDHSDNSETENSENSFQDKLSRVTTIWRVG